jgi:hypothetical protein
MDFGALQRHYDRLSPPPDDPTLDDLTGVETLEELRALVDDAWTDHRINCLRKEIQRRYGVLK